MSDKGAFVEHGLADEKPLKHPGGRPRVYVDEDRVRQLLAAEIGLREIARQLKIGYGTLHRVVQRLKSQSVLIQYSGNGA